MFFLLLIRIRIQGFGFNYNQNQKHSLPQSKETVGSSLCPTKFLMGVSEKQPLGKKDTLGKTSQQWPKWRKHSANTSFQTFQKVWSLTPFMLLTMEDTNNNMEKLELVFFFSLRASHKSTSQKHTGGEKSEPFVLSVDGFQDLANSPPCWIVWNMVDKWRGWHTSPGAPSLRTSLLELGILVLAVAEVSTYCST